LRHALPLCKQRALINSIPDEPGRFEAVLPLLKEYRAKVIALCMAESGPPAGVEDRLATACRLVDRLTAEGLALEDIYVDPCVLPVSTGPEQWQIGGGGNQPDHDTVSRCAHQRGAEQCVLRPALAEAAKPELHGVAYVTRAGCGYRRPVRPSTHGQRRAAEALLGRDEYSAEYLRAFREGRLKLLVS
jgi:5-methyltetrahydrofolate--homocysteine methyltransferase